MFLRFLVFSGSAAAVNILTGWFLYRFLGLKQDWEYIFSVSVAFLAGMTVSYILNRRYTFPETSRTMREEFTAFFGVSIGGLLLTTGLAYALFSMGFGVPRVLSNALPIHVHSETLSHIAAVAGTAGYSFLAHRHISFRRA